MRKRKFFLQTQLYRLIQLTKFQTNKKNFTKLQMSVLSFIFYFLKYITKKILTVINLL